MLYIAGVRTGCDARLVNAVYFSGRQALTRRLAEPGHDDHPRDNEKQDLTPTSGSPTDSPVALDGTCGLHYRLSAVRPHAVARTSTTCSQLPLHLVYICDMPTRRSSIIGFDVEREEPVGWRDCRGGHTGSGRRARHGRQRDPPGDRRDRRRPAAPHRRGGVARRAARPRHVLVRRGDPVADRRRRDRRARRVPHVMDATASAGSGPSRPARSAKPATATCSSIASGAAPASSSTSSTRPKRAGCCSWRCSDTLETHAAFSGARTLLIEVGGGSTSLTLLRRGQPTRSGVYALGAIRLRQQLDLAAPQPRRPARAAPPLHRERHRGDPASRSRSNRITHFIALGGDVRFAAAQILDSDTESGTREVPRDAFLAFCDEVERLDEDELVERFRLPAVEAETLVPALLVYRALLAETAARRLVDLAMPRCAPACCSTSPSRAAGSSTEEFERQVLASAEALGQRYRFDRAHGRHVADAGGAAVRRAARRARPRRRASGCCWRWPRCCTTSASTSACARTTSTPSTSSRRRRSSACRTRRRRSSRTSPATTAAALPQKTHLPYVALDREDRIIVNKLAAILRLANALDAEHVQKVQDVRLRATRHDLDARARRHRRPDDGAAGRHRARRHVRRDVRARSW